jgi:hypothetical protein
MTFFEAQEIYKDLSVNLQYAEIMGKTKEQIFEEYALKYGTDKVRECVDVLREKQNEEHQGRLEILNMVRIINGGSYSMDGNVLNFLVATLNSKIRDCKNKLEVEEKSKEVAFLQGNLSGYKTLIGYLCKEFELKQCFIEDAGEQIPDLHGCDTAYIKKLWLDLKSLLADERLKKVTDAVTSKILELKEVLFFEAASARDLYIIQGQHQGITVYHSVFQTIQDEFERRSQELDFNNGESATEIAAQITSKAGKLGKDA